MSAVSACPQCHRHVSLPATDDHSGWVRCPHCQAQYSLQAALEYLPPALEIVPVPAPLPTPEHVLTGAAHVGFDEFELDALPGEHPAIAGPTDEHAVEHPLGEHPADDHVAEHLPSELELAEHPGGEVGFTDGINGEHASEEHPAAEHPADDEGELGEHEFRFADEHVPSGAFGEAERGG